MANIGALSRYDMVNTCEADDIIADVSSNMRETREVTLITSGNGYEYENSIATENDFTNESCGEVIDRDDLCCEVPLTNTKYNPSSYTNKIARNSIFAILFDQYYCMICDAPVVKCNICGGFIPAGIISRYLPVSHFKICGKDSIVYDDISYLRPYMMKLSRTGMDYFDAERDARNIGVFTESRDKHGVVINCPTEEYYDHLFISIRDDCLREKFPYICVVKCTDPMKFDNNDIVKYGALCTMTSGQYSRDHECLSCGGSFDSFPTSEVVMKHIKKCIKIEPRIREDLCRVEY